MKKLTAILVVTFLLVVGGLLSNQYLEDASGVETELTKNQAQAVADAGQAQSITSGTEVSESNASGNGEAVTDGSSGQAASSDQKKENKTEEGTTAVQETTTKKVAEDAEVTLISLGDDLLGQSILDVANQGDGSYDFHFLFQNLTSDIANADIAVINQETILGGDALPFAGYPNFNSPSEVGVAEADAGFDVILHATNHSRDAYEQGVLNCLDFWKTNYPDIKVLGINDSQKAQDTIPIMERNGIKIAMLNYTYGMNGYELTKERPWLVNLIDQDRIVSDIKKARKKADFVIVFPHWGTEYVYEPTSEQTTLAQAMADAGADLIIGTHPHVLEPVKWLEGKDGNKTLCYYSLGNYISVQDEDKARMLGGMARLTIKRTDGVTAIDTAKLVPLVTYYDFDYTVTQTYKLSQFPSELETSHGMLMYDPTFSIAALDELAQQVVGSDWIEYE